MTTTTALHALRLRCSIYRMCTAGDALVGSSRAGRAHADVCDAIDRAERAGASVAEVERVMRAEGLLADVPRATAPMGVKPGLTAGPRMGGTA